MPEARKDVAGPELLGPLQIYSSPAKASFSFFATLLLVLYAIGAHDTGRSRLPGDSLTRVLSGNDDPARIFAAIQIDKASLEQAAVLYEEGKLRAGWITLFDNQDQDGDVVSVQSAGLSQFISLTKTPTQIPLIYIPGQPVRVTAIRDGNGGITLAVLTASGPLPFPPMPIGSSVEVPYP